LKALNDFVKEMRDDPRYDIKNLCKSKSCASGKVEKKVPPNKKVENLRADHREQVIVPCCKNKKCVAVFIACCENHNCTIFIHAVQDALLYPENAYFKNCDISQWPEDDWEVAKAFFRDYSKNRTRGETEQKEEDQNTGGSDTLDFAGYLELLMNCLKFKWITVPIDLKEVTESKSQQNIHYSLLFFS